MARKDLTDFVYQTELAKWKAVLNQSKTCYEKGQPVLIGTASVEKSEFLSELFTLSKIPHQVLNAKPENVTRESEIVALAGEKSAVTIATNMAGRGTDIILGGNPIFKVKQKLSDFLIDKKESTENEIEKFVSLVFEDYQNQVEQLETDVKNIPYSLETASSSLRKFYDFLYKTIYAQWEKDNTSVKEAGGLFVLGTERHETRRIDNQLRGRAGRQGDPGYSQFFVSLEDDLIKVFGGDSIRRWVEYLIQDKDVPLESELLTKSLEGAQEKVELYNYELRKNVFQYDDILNTQRKQIFRARNEMLSENIYQDLFLRYGEYLLDEQLISGQKISKFGFFNSLEQHFAPYSGYWSQKKEKEEVVSNELYCEVWISNDLRCAESNLYQFGFLKSTRSTTLLSIIDFYWTEHIERMGYIRETINWRAYGQQNPLIEYNMEAFKSFKLMFEQIRSSMIYYFLNNSIH
jgi:preprotein translocase subunit SecA